MHPKVLAVALLATSKLTAFTPEDVEQFLGGLVMGLIQKDDLTKIEQCLTDAGGLESEMEEAIQDFMKGDLSDIIAGVEMVGKIIQELPTDLGDCQSMQADITRIEAWAQIFTNPTQLVETLITNTIANFSDITADISKTSQDIAAGDMYNTGEDIADIMVLELGKVPAMPEDLEITQW